MKTWKKVLIFGVVCYAGYKLGQKYLEENDMTARDVLHKAQTKAKDAAGKAAAKAKAMKAERDARKQAEKEAQPPKSVYPFGVEKRVEIVKLYDDLTGLFDNKLNYPVEKEVRSYSEEDGVLYVYADDADYVVKDPFFMTVYVKDKDKAAAKALELGHYYSEAEVEVRVYGSDTVYPLKDAAAEAQAEAADAEAEAAEGTETVETTAEPAGTESAAGAEEPAGAAEAAPDAAETAETK
ncbi:MAG: hypothetical protein VZQ81_02830 [Succiniclasticum sp.]|jgi:hypothetical protein|nr:hypothetical protein [Succiniclasticum sp.]MEE3478944.1 hypothetical protein [Succiniclasticum sp.]